MADTKEVRLYTVITCAGNWGKGSTPLEAAKNARVTGTYVRGSLYYANQNVVDGEVQCTEMGGYSFHWNKEVLPILESNKFLVGVAMDAVIKASGKLRIRSGKLECLSAL